MTATVGLGPLAPAEVEAFFTRADGRYAFARWGSPVVPVVFGVDEATQAIVTGAVEGVAALAQHPTAGSDPELGANLMIFHVARWADLRRVPGLARLIDGLDPLCARLDAAGANQYRVFRFDADGSIRAAFAFVRMDADLEAVPARALALSQAVQVFLLWSDRAFTDRSPLARVRAGETGEALILRPEIGALIRAAYDPVLPAATRDPAHALRLFARIGLRS